MTPALPPAMPWYELHEFLRGFQRNWEVVGLTGTSDAPDSGQQELRIRIRLRAGPSAPAVAR